MVRTRNHLMYHFSITIHLHLANFYEKIIKKKQAREMIIENIEFELRGPTPPGRTRTPITG